MSMGYMGYVQLANAAVSPSYTTLLCTGSSLNLILEPIYSTAVWGAGWLNAAETTNYADNAIRYEGGIDFELQSGNVWDLLHDWAISNRIYPKNARISPDGYRQYQYLATYPSTVTDQGGLWNRGMTIATNEASPVTVSADSVGLSRNEVLTGNSYEANDFGIVTTDNNGLSPLNPGGSDNQPIPFWKTKAGLIATGGLSTWNAGTETVEWSIDYTNNTLILYTCRGVRGPTAVLQGVMGVTATATFFNFLGIPDPSRLGPAATTEFYVSLNTTKTPVTTNGYLLRLPYVVIETDDYGVRGQNDVCSRVYTMKGLSTGGNTENTGAPLIMTTFGP